MEFGLSEEQRLLQDSVAAFLQGASSLDCVRQAIEGAGSAAADLQHGLADVGVDAVLVPEAYGGLGLKLLEAALVQEMLGRHVTPAPFASNVMGVTALLAAGSEAQQRDHLPLIVDGSKRFGIALGEQIGSRDGARVVGSSGALSGHSLFVLGFEDATDFIVSDCDGNLHIIAADEPNLEKRRLTSIDQTRSIGKLILDGVRSDALVSEQCERRAVERVISAGRVLLAADTLGACDMMIEQAVAYAKERKQFGRVIGSFQAVKHMCAEMAAELEPCRSLVWYSAHAFDATPADAAIMACHAKSHLAEVGQFVARTATEVFGGIGFTDDLGLHLWFKRIGVNRQWLGGPERVREHAATLQGWTVA